MAEFQKPFAELSEEELGVLCKMKYRDGGIDPVCLKALYLLMEDSGDTMMFTVNRAIATLLADVHPDRELISRLYGEY